MQADRGQNTLSESTADGSRVTGLDNPNRLAALAELEILDEPVERNFEMLSDLASSLLTAPVALVTLVTDDRQFFVSSHGLAEPWSSRRETPLSHSFCQHVVTRREPLVINNAVDHPLVCDNFAIKDLGVAAYLGVPLVHNEESLGSFCVIDDKPRVWTNDNLDSLLKLAQLATSELATRKAARQEQAELETRLRQSQKLEAIGQLTAGVAHDFNNVLWAIQIRANLLKRELPDDSPALTHVDHVDEAVCSAQGIVKQLLNWSRPGEHDSALISLTQIIEDALPLLKTSTSPRVAVAFESHDDPGRIVARTNQIHQILLNLCNNADHAMKKTGGEIRFTVTTRDLDTSAAQEFELAAGKYVELNVADHGSGIPAEALHQIYDPYFTTKPVGEGTGLGLWNVREIVRNHGAKMKVASKPNEGTTFTILFPAATVSAASLSAASQAAPVLPGKTTAKVLVVDHEKSIADGLSQLLRKEGFDVVTFHAGTEACKYFLEDPAAIDIVIANRAMPNLSGNDLLAKCKAVRPSLRMILCSGYAEDLNEADHAALRPDAYCVKPYDCDELCRVIRRLLDDGA